MSRWSRIWALAIGLAVPARCRVCGRPCEVDEAACRACGRALAACEPAHLALAGVGPVACAAPYEGVARELVHALKFRGRPGLAHLAAGAIEAALPPAWRSGAIVAVPADPWRELRRGFDPADALAKALSERLGLPRAAVLERRAAPRQVGRSRADRLAGPAVEAFAPAPPRCLLVDDVLTTGATLRCCASALRAAGATEVRALVFARTSVELGECP